jgi:ParB-like chromosome segregation protein Spo0J
MEDQTKESPPPNAESGAGAEHRMEVHPAAELDPLMSGPKFDAFVEDIRNRGQQEPIKLLGGKIIDGRNRWAACHRLGIKPWCVNLEEVMSNNYPKTDEDVRDYVLSANHHRRHLNAGQTAAIAAMLATAGKGRQPKGCKALTVKQAAERFGVGERWIEMAKQVQKIDEGLFNEVYRGNRDLSEVAKKLGIKPDGTKAESRKTELVQPATAAAPEDKPAEQTPATAQPVTDQKVEDPAPAQPVQQDQPTEQADKPGEQVQAKKSESNRLESKPAEPVQPEDAKLVRLVKLAEGEKPLLSGLVEIYVADFVKAFQQTYPGIAWPDFARGLSDAFASIGKQRKRKQ